MFKYNINNNAFTLVELIVVITILAVLATIGFISFQGYVSTSRDSARLSDMANIEKGLNMKTSIAKKLPYPDDKIQITASGTLLNYQGYAGVSVLGNIEVHGGGIDPLDQTYYTYSINDRRNKYQILGYLENKSEISFTQNTYANLNDRILKLGGAELGIFVDPITQEPVQGNGIDIDVVNTLTEYTTFLNTSSNGTITGTGSELVKIGSYNKNFISCKSIIDTYGYGINKGIYKINPTGSDNFEVYCDMETDGGGWTLIGRTAPISGECLGNFGWYKSCGSPDIFDFPYSLGINKVSDFEKIMIAKSNQINNIPTDYAYVKYISKGDLEGLKSTGFYSAGSAQAIIGNCGIVKMLDGHGYTNYGNFDDSKVSTTHDNDLFWFKDGLNNGATVYPFGMRVNGFVLYGAYNGTCDSGMLGTEQGLIYIK